MIKNLNSNDFSLVLSGGGALGIAHLGVIADLEKAHIVPSEIVGTSMGGIIGACMAIGLKESAIYAHIKDFSSIHKWVSFSFKGNAIVGTKKIEKIFDNIFANRKMCETHIPLKLIATHLASGEKKVFDANDNVTIKDALLSTMAIPGIFKEHTINENIYVDGFLCENLGINEASSDNILAVDVLGKNAYSNEMPDNFFKTANVIEMFEKSMRLLILNQSRLHMRHSNKNITLIEPSTRDYNTFHFHKYKELREIGLNLV
ncbi:MAG: patatin-like phospholipase family protein [Campylobacterota bacterium]|nr:patatin-like phospholipase family protein [Campylobacterota bacterium]